MEDLDKEMGEGELAKAGIFPVVNSEGGQTPEAESIFNVVPGEESIMTSEQKQEMIRQARSIDDLLRILDEIGPIPNSDGSAEYTSDDIKETIFKIFIGRSTFENITRTYDLRKTVISLIRHQIRVLNNLS